MRTLRTIRSATKRVNLEYTIAKRMTQGADGRGVMVRIATLSVAIGIAVMIVTMAVVVGFKQEVTRRIVGFTSHARVTDIRGMESATSEPIARTNELESIIRSTQGFANAWPYAQKEGIVKMPDAVMGMLLKGVDASYDWSFFASFMTQGSLPKVGDSIRTKDILISRLAADKLMLNVGDKVEMLFVEEQTTPRRDRFRVSGIYATGMDELDNTMLITDIRNVQRLSGWSEDQITGYEVLAHDFNTSESLAAELSNALLYSELDHTQNLIVSSVGELYPSIFDWLRAHDVNAAVVIIIMIIVAFFNMATALLILVLERTRMIGLLKTMGMRDRAIQQIFLWRASFIILRGLVWGNVVGVGLCLAQQHFHILRLSSEGYLLSEVPVALDLSLILLLNIGAAATIVLMMALPARAVSTVKPSETIRYE